MPILARVLPGFISWCLFYHPAQACELSTRATTNEALQSAFVGECDLLIRLGVGVYSVSGDTGARKVVLLGAGKAETRVDGVLRVPAGGTLTLEQVTVAEVRSQGDALRLTRVVARSVSVEAGGAWIEESTVTGGGVLVAPHARLSVVRSAFVQNEISHVQGALEVRRSTFSRSPLLLGFQVHTLRRSTFWNSPIQTEPGAQVRMHANLAQAEQSVCDSPSRFVSEGLNVLSDASCQFVDGWQARAIGALADNGGGTPTHVQRSDSPGVNAYACDDLDQRGAAPSGLCDVGAYERTGVRLSMSAEQTAGALVYTVKNVDSVRVSELVARASCDGRISEDRWPLPLVPGESRQSTLLGHCIGTLAIDAFEGVIASPLALERGGPSPAEEVLAAEQDEPADASDDKDATDDEDATGEPVRRRRGCAAATSPSWALLLVKCRRRALACMIHRPPADRTTD